MANATQLGPTHTERFDNPKVAGPLETTNRPANHEPAMSSFLRRTTRGRTTRGGTTRGEAAIEGDQGQLPIHRALQLRAIRTAPLEDDPTECHLGGPYEPPRNVASASLARSAFSCRKRPQSLSAATPQTTHDRSGRSREVHRRHTIFRTTQRQANNELPLSDAAVARIVSGYPRSASNNLCVSLHSRVGCAVNFHRRI